MTEATSAHVNYPAVLEGVIGTSRQKIVSGRALHAFLQVATPFKDWIARRIADYGFMADLDFRSFLRGTRGRPAREYDLSLDMAKQLAMVERTEQGRLVRRYFIECERMAVESETLDEAAFQELVRASRVGQRNDTKSWAPPRVNESAGDYSERQFSLPEAAKILSISVRHLLTWLRQNLWLIRPKSVGELLPLHHRIKDGDLVEVSREGALISRINLTARGLMKLARFILPTRHTTEVKIEPGQGHLGKGFFVARKATWKPTASYIVVMIVPTLWHGSVIHMVHEPGNPKPSHVADWLIRNKVSGLQDATEEYGRVTSERRGAILV